jgi:hypothetical protein
MDLLPYRLWSWPTIKRRGVIMSGRLEIEFERKPSKNQVLKEVIAEFNAGYHTVDLSWGENWISIEKWTDWELKTHNFIGHGWIKDISGSDLADQLNQEGI